MPASNPSAPASAPPAPWWRHAGVWLLLSGPAIVVVASIAMMVVAARGADPLVGEEAARKVQALQQRPDERALLPALQARNHAATPTAAGGH